MARPMMFASASGELKTRVAAERALQAVRDLEHAALAGHAFERRLAAAVGDVLAEDDDARVARHLVLQRAVDRRDHRVRLAFGTRRASRTPPRWDRRPASRRRASTVSRPGFSAVYRAFGGLVHLALDLLDDRLELGLAGEPLRLEELRQPRDRIALALRRRARPASCTAARRPTASASTGRITLAWTSAGPLRARA